MVETFARPPLTLASISLLFAFIALTPMCGYLFSCGCTWPWAGLARDCNYFDPQSPLHCPWCDNKLLGLGSMLVTGFAAVAGSLAPELARGDFKLASLRMAARPMPMAWIAALSLLRLGLGIGFFLLAAVGFGWLTIALTGYEKFIF